jgi:hypothetical protein
MASAGEGYYELNKRKYAVIGAMEDFLPASPFWRAEFAASRTGSDRGGYWSVIIGWETWISVLFAAAYVFGFVMAIVL